MRNSPSSFPSTAQNPLADSGTLYCKLAKASLPGVGVRGAPTVHAIRPDFPVTVLPGLNHIGMITDPGAIPAALRGHS